MSCHPSLGTSQNDDWNTFVAVAITGKKKNNINDNNYPTYHHMKWMMQMMMRTMIGICAIQNCIIIEMKEVQHYKICIVGCFGFTQLAG